MLYMSYFRKVPHEEDEDSDEEESSEESEEKDEEIEEEEKVCFSINVNFGNEELSSAARTRIIVKKHLQEGILSRADWMEV